jgi:hypothetical protein
MDKNRTTAILILGKLENLLAQHNIMIPDSHRLGEDDEACIFGETYYALEDEITDLLNRRDMEEI